MAISQTKNATGSKTLTTGTTFTIALSSSAGDLILVAVAIPSSSVTVSGITDNGNTYHNVGAKTQGSLRVELWKTDAVNPIASGTLTVTCSASGARATGVAESYSGVAFAGTAASTNNGTTSPITGGSTALVETGDWVVLAGGTAANNAFSTQNGSIRGQVGTTGVRCCLIDSNAGATPVTCSATMTNATWATVENELRLVAAADNEGPNWSERLDIGRTAVTNVQNASASATSVSSQAVTISSSVAGDLLVLCVILAGDHHTDLSAADSAGQNYSKAICSFLNGAGTIGIFYFPNTAAGVTSITASWTGVSTGGIVAGEFSGVIGSSPFDQAAALENGFGVTNWTSGNTSALAQASELVLGWAADFLATTDTFTPGAGFTAAYNAGGGGFTEYKQVNSKSAVAATGATSLGSADIYAAVSTFDLVMSILLSGLNDSLTQSDVVAIGLGDVITDSISFSDKIVVGIGLVLSDSNSANWADAFVESSSATLVLSDFIGTSTIPTTFPTWSNTFAANRYWPNQELTGTLTPYITDSFAEQLLGTTPLTLVLSDSLSFSDSLQIGYGLLAADTDTLSDATTFILGISLSLADQLTQSDALAIGFGDVFAEQLFPSDQRIGGCWPNSNWDNASWADHSQVYGGLLIGYGDLIAETLSLSDSLAIGYGFLIAESLSLSEQYVLGYGNIISDSLTLSDLFAFALGEFEILADSLTQSDSLAIGYGNGITDSITFSDSTGVGYGLDISDSLTLSDAFVFDLTTNILELDEVLSDSLSQSDELGIGYGNQITDALMLSDSISFVLSFEAVLADAVSLSDSIVVGYGNAVDDLLTLSESLLIGYGNAIADDANNWLDLFETGGAEAVNIAETLSFSDAIVIGIGDLISDSLSLSDALTVEHGDQITDSVNFWNDAVAFSESIELAISDSLSFADSLAIGYGNIVSDSANNYVDVIVVAEQFDLVIAETFTVSDQLTIGIGLLVNETLTITEAVVSSYGLIISETVTVSESIVAGYGMQIAEQVALSDSTSIAESMEVGIVDQMPAYADLLQALMNYRLSVGENLNLWLDTVSLLGELQLAIAVDDIIWADQIVTILEQRLQFADAEAWTDAFSIAVELQLFEVLADSESANWLDAILKQFTNLEAIDVFSSTSYPSVKVSGIQNSSKVIVFQSYSGPSIIVTGVTSELIDDFSSESGEAVTVGGAEVLV